MGHLSLGPSNASAQPAPPVPCPSPAQLESRSCLPHPYLILPQLKIGDTAAQLKLARSIQIWL